MASINARGLLVGGLVAGLIINVSEFVLNGVLLADDMAAAMSARNLPAVAGSAVAVFVAVGFVLGLALVWVYAAIRPRFGAGPKTAAIAGLAVWFLAYVYGSLGMGAIGLFPMRLLVIGIVWGLVELIVAALAGGRLYSET